MYILYSALLAAVMVVTLPYWLWQMVRQGKYRAGLRERLGRVPERLTRGGRGRRIWVHAVSVGEVIAVSGMVEKLKQRFPQHRVIVSTTTDTGQKLARTRFGQESVFYVPMDFGFAILPYVQSLRPDLLVIAETEFWPNLLHIAKLGGARVAVVNARISDRSQHGYWRFRSLLRRVLDDVDLFLAQSEEDRRRLVKIGAAPDRIQVTGNLKFDTAAPVPPPVVDRVRRALSEAGAGPVLVCGSTVEDEEPLLVRAFENVRATYPSAVMILAPRHPERFAEVAQLLERLRMPNWRRSAWNGEPIPGGVFLLDSIGELAALYALADVAFVGGSLVLRGGHNILEPAQHGVAIVVGNHTENFRDIISLFQKNDAVKVVGPAELPLVFMELLSNDAGRAALGQRAAQTLQAQTGATERTLDALQALLNMPGGRAG
jgi:3-deoxy-D-manno-octulosonic-acid transferase